MVTIINKNVNDNPEQIVCKSTDTKPTDVLNGALCLEMDTGKFYAFDKDAASWIELGA